MTEEDKNVKQWNLAHLLLSSLVNNDLEGFEKIVMQLSELREESVSQILFDIVRHLDSENRHLNKAMAEMRKEIKEVQKHELKCI